MSGLGEQNRRQTRSDLVVGVAWYRRQEWQRLLDVSIDREDLESTYDEWFAAMPARIVELEQAGVKAHKIDVPVDELVSWCQQNGRLVNASARADYVANKLHQLGIQRKLDEPGA
jgi:hypothetical protein